MPRRKTIPIQDRLGRITRRPVNVENLGDYGRIVTNNRGRVAYVKKSSEVKALEIVRGEGASLRRVRFVFKGKYPTDTPEKKAHRLKLEADLTVTIPSDDVEDFRADILAWTADQAQRFGLEAEDWSVEIERDEPAYDVAPSVESSTVLFRNRAVDSASDALRAQATALLDEYAFKAGDNNEEEAEALERAEQRTDKRGRTYWVDPMTGRRTLNPELIR